ncbi:MAG: nitrite/sulfite reductase [Proteobacteria bacterium]|nr:nitrite/sulfite reductase [Pseudomonadota bacterium]MDE3208866.1 nitrite/sulfite reductase [Pseudomonadota bacterium]
MMLDASSIIDFEEIDRYESAVNAYLNLQMDADRFMSMRLQQGVYGQRQEGVHMVRCKIPGGEMTGEQLKAIGDTMESVTDHPLAHVTTRQDIQLHYVPVAQTPKALKLLAQAGITTREACNNTIRNITMAPLSGLCPGEIVDITPFKDATVHYLLRHPLTQYMPRKYKISFSSCASDTAQGMMHDIGVVPVSRDGQFGFKVLAGGGLGHKPYEAIVAEEFLEEHLLIPTIEALISLHHKYSDRTKRAKSRSKFLVVRFGVDGFLEKYREEVKKIRESYAGPVPHGAWNAHPGNCICGTGAPRKITAQKQEGLFIVPVSLPIGDMTAKQMRGIAQLLKIHNLDRIRTTQDQNLIIPDVPLDKTGPILSGLKELGLGLPQTGDDVVACPGTTTCRLGITGSRKAATRITGGIADLKIRISGCQNGCAQPEMADIGIYGQGKRLFGRLIPHYQMYFGGDGRTGYGIAIKGPEVPVARTEQAVARVEEAYLETRNENESFYFWTRRMGKDYFSELLADLVAVKEEDIPSVLHDLDDEGDFKVLQLGGGECAGSAHNPATANFSEAAYERTCRNSLIYQRQFESALECNQSLTRLVGQALLFVTGHKQPLTDDLDEIAALLSKTQPDLSTRLSRISESQKQLAQTFDAPGFTVFCTLVDKWMDDAARLAMKLDPQLDLTMSMTEKVLTTAWVEARLVTLDKDSLEANAEQARQELGHLTKGDELHLLVSSNELAQGLVSVLSKEGQRILGMEPEGHKYLLKIQKNEAA